MTEQTHESNEVERHILAKWGDRLVPTMKGDGWSSEDYDGWQDLPEPCSDDCGWCGENMPTQPNVQEPKHE